jgi:protein-S-isoprenylcysteine O-methyltransferase Ste14
LALIGQLILILGMFLGPVKEDKINTMKWGDKYRQYMKEVPRFNFILGLWNLRKRGK